MVKSKEHKKPFATAKLIFYDWGWRENVIYRLTAGCNEKNRGLLMIAAIKNYFGISSADEKKDEEIRIKREIRAIRPIKFTRDEKGNLASPFRSKKIF